MPQRHPSIDLIAHLHGLSPAHGCASSDGRYQAALLGADTVIVDIHRQRMHRASGVYAREFDDAPPDGLQAPALRVEGEETATAYLPTWTDAQWIALADADTPPGFWQPWPDPRELGLPPLQERLPTEWTSAAPQATERAKKPVADWVAWLIALAVLLFFATFGFQAMTWALRGGWHWLWMAVGAPVFGIFSVTSVTMVVGRLRERRRIRVALDNLSLERGEGFRVGEPLAVRLRATVAAAQEGERTVAPQGLVMRLMRRSIRSEADGGWTLVDACCDEAVAHLEEEAEEDEDADADARAGRRLYGCELCASPAPGPAAGAAQWSVELHDPGVAGGAPFVVAALRLLPAR